ncbi:MAG: hypothetical protein ABI653_01150, partial [Bacteroidota bacterium]
FKGESTNKNEADYANRFYGAMNIFVSKHYAGGSGLLKKIFLRAGIFSASIFYKMKLLFNRKSSSKIKEDAITYHLTGDAQAITEAESILLKAGIHANKIHDPEVLKNQKEPFRNSAIVFCIGSFTLEDAMQYMNPLSQNEYYFHFAGSNSIIGSNDKNSTGIFFTN